MSATLGHGLWCLRLHSLNVDGPTLFGHLESTGVVNASVKRKMLVFSLSQRNPEEGNRIIPVPGKFGETGLSYRFGPGPLPGRLSRTPAGGGPRGWRFPGIGIGIGIASG